MDVSLLAHTMSHASGSIDFSTLSNFDGTQDVMAAATSRISASSDVNRTRTSTEAGFEQGPPTTNDFPMDHTDLIDNETLMRQAQEAEIDSMVRSLEESEEITKEQVAMVRKASLQLKENVSKLYKSRALAEKTKEELRKLGQGRYPAQVAPFKLPFSFPEVHETFADEDRTFTIRIPRGTSYAGAKHIVFLEGLALDRAINVKCIEKRIANLTASCGMDDYIMEVTKPINDVAANIASLGVNMPDQLFSSQKSLSKSKAIEVYKDIFLKEAKHDQDRKNAVDAAEDERKKVVKFVEKRSPEEWLDLKLEKKIEAMSKRGKNDAKKGEKLITPPKKPDEGEELTKMYDVDWVNLPRGDLEGVDTSSTIVKKSKRRYTKKQLAQKKHKQGEYKAPEDGGDKKKKTPKQHPQNGKTTKGKGKGKAKGKGKGKGSSPPSAKGKGKGKTKGKGKGKGTASQDGSKGKSKGKRDGKRFKRT